MENRRIQNECITYKLVQPLLIPHDLAPEAPKDKDKLGQPNPTFNIFHEYLQDEIDYKKVNLWYNMEIRMKGDRYLHRKFRRREREERRTGGAWLYKTKYEFQQYTKKKRAEQAASARIQREIRIKEAIEKEKEEEEQRLRKLLMVEEEEDAAAKKKKEEEKKRRRKKEEEWRRDSDDGIELDVDFL